MAKQEKKIAKKERGTISFRQAVWHELRQDALARWSLITLLGIMVIVYVSSLFFRPDSYIEVNIMNQYLTPMTDGHLLGTDNGGHDVLLMLMIGARNSFNIALGVSLITLLIGNILGVLTGYYGKKFDFIVMRVVDFWMILPALMMIIVLVTIIPRFNAWSLIGIMSIFSWIGTTRLIRAQTLTEVNRDHVRASKTSGTSDIKIMFREIWPNLSSLVIAEATLVFAANVGLEVGLSYLGFGLPAGTPSLGTMLNEATNPEVMTARPWVWLPATVLLLIVVIAIIFIGQALRRVADRQQATR